jgi:hypothetical protein
MNKVEIADQVRKGGLWLIMSDDIKHVSSKSVLSINENGFIIIGYPIVENKIIIDMANVNRNWFLTAADARAALEKRRGKASL